MEWSTHSARHTWVAILRVSSVEKKGILKQKAQCIPFDKFLQHQIFPVLLRHFIHSGQIRAGIVQELAVNLRVSDKAMQNESLSGGFVADQPYAAPSPLLHLPDLFIFFL